MLFTSITFENMLLIQTKDIIYFCVKIKQLWQVFANICNI
jgi:hypothetical protein